MADTIKDVKENVPSWQFNVIPGNANQGAILMTRTPLTNPPFKQSDFIWWAMEDIIGVANMKLEYDEEANLYRLYKATGHMDNEGDWTYTWEFVGDWAALTEEVVDILRLLNYVEYIYDTSEPNELKVIGVNKDGTQELLCDIHFASTEYVDNAVNNIQTNLDNEIARATQREDAISENLSNEITRARQRENEIDDDLTTEVSRAVNRENELQAMIQQATINPGVAIEVVGTDNQVNVKYDNDSIKVNASNELKADVFDDTQVSNTKGWSSAKISQEMTSAMHYKGQVATYNDLPSTGQATGDVYNVVDTGDNYAWNGNSWDKLSGEYIQGTGIRIQGKVISATGVAFQVGSGLQSQHVGTDDDILSIKNGHGLEIDTNGANKVKGGNGIDVNANGVNVTTGDTTQIVSDKVEVKPHNGLVSTENGLDINANFSIKTTPLGTESSKLAIYSDGKVAVDFTESSVVLTGELLKEVYFPTNSNYIDNVSVPKMNDYDMYVFDMGAKNNTTGVWNSYKQDVFFKPAIISDLFQTTPARSSMNGDVPSGLLMIQYYYKQVNAANNIIGKIMGYYINSWITGATGWSTFDSTVGTSAGVKIYGIKAR